MQPWLAQQRSLIQQAEAIRAGEDVVAQIAARIESHRAELAQCLAALRRTDSILSPCAEPAGTGSSASDPADGSLHRWLERSQTTLDRLTAAADRREQIRRDSKKFEAALKAARVKADRAETELNAWNQQWAAAIAPLGLAPETSPETADYVLAQIAEMFVRRAKAQDHSERIEGIQRDAEEFQRRVEMLVGETAPELAGSSFEQAAEQLLVRLSKAKSDRQKRADLKKQEQRYQAEYEKARETVESTTARLAAMCQEAGCQTPAELPEIERASATATRLQENLGTLDDQLAELSAGAGLDSFVAEVEAAGADQLPGQAKQLAEEIQSLEAERDEVLRAVISEEQTLAAMDSSAQTAEAAEEVQDVLGASRPTPRGTSACAWPPPSSAAASSDTVRRMRDRCSRKPAGSSSG